MVLSSSCGTPNMAQEADITALMSVSKRNKRKRSSVLAAENNALRPVMKGTLTVSSGKVVWSGAWGLTKTGFDEDFPQDVTRAPFRFERTSIVRNSNNQDEKIILSSVNGGRVSADNICQDGYFSGYFCMQTPSVNISGRNNENGSQSMSMRKHFENNLLLRFRMKNGCSSELEIVGSGENRFGKFLIEGKYDISSACLTCGRNYLPQSLKRKSSRVHNIGPPSMALTIDVNAKRSVRIKKPSPKWQEFIESKKNKKNTSLSDFDGRKDLLRLVRLLILSDREENLGMPLFDAGIFKIEQKLLLKRYKDFLKAKKDIWIGLSKIIGQGVKQPFKSASAKSLKIHAVITEFKLDVIKLGKKNNVKIVDDVTKVPIRPKLPVEPKEDLPQQNSDEISDMENVFNLIEIDPLCADPCADIPTCMTSPPLFDMKDTFTESPQEPNCQPKTETTSKIEETLSGELTPLVDVDFSDLSYLDAETLHELNKCVEFSCPSKGA